jgi:hypothetical protein
MIPSARVGPRFLDPKTNTSEPGLDSKIFNESKMAVFYECMVHCVATELDRADMVREASFQQLFRNSLSRQTGGRYIAVPESCFEGGSDSLLLQRFDVTI